MLEIVPLASVTISNVAPLPANSETPATALNDAEGSYAAAVALKDPGDAPRVPSSNVAIVPATN